MQDEEQKRKLDEQKKRAKKEREYNTSLFSQELEQLRKEIGAL